MDELTFWEVLIAPQLFWPLAVQFFNFSSYPFNAHLYFLKLLLHDWKHSFANPSLWHVAIHSNEVFGTESFNYLTSNK